MNNAIDLKVEALVPSKTNRKFFDQAALDELTANVKEVGILQDLLVRPIEGSDMYELVFGERRWRAASAAGLETVPCKVRALSDREALEIQMVENLQREDVDPIEEAESLRAMLDLVEADGSRVYTQKLLGERIGKTQNFVTDRVLLTNLNKTLREAVRMGKLPVKTAQEIGRIPNAAARKEAGEAVLKLGLNFVEARELIGRKYMRSLKGAPFDREDVDLVAAAGACEVCPKRSGNMGEAFAKSPHMCCDPDCYAQKCEAAWVRQSAKAVEAGTEVLSDAESRMLFDDTGRHLNFTAAFVLWPDRPERDLIKPEVEWERLESWSSLVGEVVRPVLARVPATGRGVLLARLDACLTAAVEMGEGDLFKDAVLRAHAAKAGAAGGGEHRTSNIEHRTSNDEDDEGSDEAGENAADPVAKASKAEIGQKEAKQRLADLRERVAGYFEDEATLCEPGQLPLAVWKLLIQAAAINLGAAGQKLYQAWNMDADSAWDKYLRGNPILSPAEYGLSLLGLLVAEWEPHMQDMFLAEFQGYVSPVVDEDPELPEGFMPLAEYPPEIGVERMLYLDTGACVVGMLRAESMDNGPMDLVDHAGAPLEGRALGWAELVIPDGFRPAHMDLPDMEVTCDVVMLDGARLVACLGIVDLDDNPEDPREVECWLNNDSGSPLEGTVIGWEYYDYEEDEDEEDAEEAEKKVKRKAFVFVCPDSGYEYQWNEHGVCLNPELVFELGKKDKLGICFKIELARAASGWSCGLDFRENLSSYQNSFSGGCGLKYSHSKRSKAIEVEYQRILTGLDTLNGRLKEAAKIKKVETARAKLNAWWADRNGIQVQAEWDEDPDVAKSIFKCDVTGREFQWNVHGACLNPILEILHEGTEETQIEIKVGWARSPEGWYLGYNYKETLSDRQSDGGMWINNREPGFEARITAVREVEAQLLDIIRELQDRLPTPARKKKANAAGVAVKEWREKWEVAIGEAADPYLLKGHVYTRYASDYKGRDETGIVKASSTAGGKQAARAVIAKLHPGAEILQLTEDEPKIKFRGKVEWNVWAYSVRVKK